MHKVYFFKLESWFVEVAFLDKKENNFERKGLFEMVKCIHVSFFSFNFLFCFQDLRESDDESPGLQDESKRSLKGLAKFGINLGKELGKEILENVLGD